MFLSETVLRGTCSAARRGAAGRAVGAGRTAARHRVEAAGAVREPHAGWARRPLWRTGARPTEAFPGSGPGIHPLSPAFVSFETGFCP
jgi:hypothetical protein